MAFTTQHEKEQYYSMANMFLSDYVRLYKPLSDLMHWYQARHDESSSNGKVYRQIKDALGAQ